MPSLSANTQAILLLTAPLINGKRESNGPLLLSQGAYRRLAKWLHSRSLSPSDLLGREAAMLAHECEAELDLPPLKPLLDRGFQLSQAVERWNQRSIWVASRADSDYPRRVKDRVGDAAPAVIYGCGDPGLLGKGGLAIVGSRNVSDELLQYTADVARLSAEAGRPVLSGGARGVDQAAMRGAGEAEGQVVGILADSLERAAIRREHRQPLMTGNLTLCSPYDPQAGFNAGHAMQRNKLIYALADAALIVNADFEKGGTWNGAIEQLETYRHIPLFVRDDSRKNKGLEALKRRGARTWPSPSNPSDLAEALSELPAAGPDRTPQSLFESEAPVSNGTSSSGSRSARGDAEIVEPAVVLRQCVERLVLSAEMPVTESELAERLDVTKSQARQWLQQLCAEGHLVRRTKPVRFEPAKDT